MGGNRYLDRKNYSDAEIDILLQVYISNPDKLKSLFNEKLYTSEKGWITALSYKLDTNSLQKLLFRIAELSTIHICKCCNTKLGYESFKHLNFNLYCIQCTAGKVWHLTENLDKDKLLARSAKVSESLISFYKTDAGKNLSSSTRDQRSASLKAYNKTSEGIATKERVRLSNSETMKNKILDGSFTPNTNNRNTHWESVLDNKVYRSSWESIYHYHNPGDSYEVLRIPYYINGKRKTYIVDFVNHDLRIATEVKPAELLENEITIAKLSALRSWCSINNYTLIIADKIHLLKLGKPNNLNRFDENTRKKINIFYKE